MRTVIQSAWACVCLLMLFPSAYADFWYDARGPIALSVDSSKVTVLFEDGITGDDQQFVLSRFARITTILSDSNAFDGFVVCSLSTSQGYDAFLDSLVATPELQLAEPYYLNVRGEPKLVGSCIAVAFESTTTAPEIDSLRNLYGPVAGDSSHFGLYYLENSGSTGMRTLDIANGLH